MFECGAERAVGALGGVIRFVDGGGAGVSVLLMEMNLSRPVGALTTPAYTAGVTEKRFSSFPVRPLQTALTRC